MKISIEENKKFVAWFISFTEQTYYSCRPELLSDLYEEHFKYLRCCLNDGIIDKYQFDSLHCHLINLFAS